MGGPLGGVAHSMVSHVNVIGKRAAQVGERRTPNYYIKCHTFTPRYFNNYKLSLLKF